MRPQQQDPDPPEQIGRGADERAESSADQRGGKLVAARAGRPDPDDACGQGDVGEHHHADHHPHGEAEPRGSPARNDDRREPQRDADDHPRSEDDRGVPSRERKPRPDLRPARPRDGEREHRVKEEARRRHERYHDDERERPGAAPPARQSAKRGENTDKTSASVTMMKTQPMTVRTPRKDPNARPLVFMVAPRKSGDTAMNPPTTTVASTAPGMSARSATSLCSRKRGTQSQKTVDATSHAGTTRSRPWALRPSAATTKSATEPARTKKKIANSP